MVKRDKWNHTINTRADFEKYVFGGFLYEAEKMVVKGIIISNLSVSLSLELYELCFLGVRYSCVFSISEQQLYCYLLSGSTMKANFPSWLPHYGIKML